VTQATLLGVDAVGVDVAATNPGPFRHDGSMFDSLTAADANGHGPYDAITAFEVLEHLIDPLAVLRDLYARLVPGGFLVVETPDCASITVPASFAEFQLVQPLEHVNTFTGETLTGIARRAGFVPRRVSPAVVAGSLRHAGRRTLGQLLHRRATSIYLQKRGSH
jgi:trans-aconitate methyltransferase